jgi:hypothetical protein
VSKHEGSIYEAESTIAVASDGTIAIAWIQNAPTGYGIGYSFSKDGGASWTASKAATNDGRLYDDPGLAVAPNGTFFLSMSGYNADGSAHRIAVATAPPGHLEFGTPVDASDPMLAAETLDKPWISVTAAGRALLTYGAISSGGLYASLSNDGKTWSQTKIAAGAKNLGYTCAGQGNTVWVVYYDDDSGSIGLGRSDDQGATWPASTFVTVSDSSEQDVSFDDPTCVTRGGDVWVSYSRTKDNVNTEQFMPRDYLVEVAHSSDGGKTIERRVVADDASIAKYFMTPTLALSEKGTLEIVYYAGIGTKDSKGSFRLARSIDHGATFEASALLETPITFAIDRGASDWLGDYSGLVAHGAHVYAAFANNVSGYSHIDFVSALAE